MLTKAQEAKLKAYAKNTPAEEQSVLFVRGVTKASMYYFMPLTAWVEPYETPMLVIMGSLLRVGNQEYGGSGSWRIPLSPGNKEPALMLLAALGWNGLIWPLDEGWPTGAPEEKGLRHILQSVPIGATFSFAPDPVKGTRVLKVLVPKTMGTMPLPIDVEAEDRVQVTEAMKARFTDIDATPTLFMPPNWSGKKRSLEGEALVTRATRA